MGTDCAKPFPSPTARSVAWRTIRAFRPITAQPWRLAAPAAVLALQVSAAHAGECPGPQSFVRIPEIVEHDGILRGTMELVDSQVLIMTRFPPKGSKAGTTVRPGTPMAIYDCSPQTVRAFRIYPQPALPTAGEDQTLPDPFPGPTLRAKLGGIVELTFVNQLDPARFGKTEEGGTPGTGTGCDVAVGIYPGSDTYPDCFHGSSTGNIHFHGTHTNPNGTADNVLLELRPSPRDANNRPTITPETYKQQFDDFFAECEAHLKGHPLAEWPSNWYGPNDPQHPGGSSLGPWTVSGTWTAMQMSLLPAKDKSDNETVAMWDKWPQYYIGAYPYCFQLPLSTASSFPPPGGMLQMGQSPGTHWYHAHKHGSTAIDVSNGMVGAFIIEGKYDEDLDAFYGKGWGRMQPVMVINQPNTSPNKMRGGGSQDQGPDFVVNGRFAPIMEMEPGEVQLWRIVNGSGRSGAYLKAMPEGFKFRQGRSLLLASGNRADLLVKAPTKPGLYPVMVQHDVDAGELGTDIPVVLLQIRISKDAPVVTGHRAEFIPTAPQQPPFLTNVTVQEANAPRVPTDPHCIPLKPNANSPCGTADNPRLVIFSTQPGAKHEIDGKQFDEDPANAKTVTLNSVEEWLIENTTVKPGPISHPFHIHVNPFQVVEFFDPNEQVTVNGASVAKYVTTTPADPTVQCQIDPTNRLTWFDCHNTLADDKVPRIWWDVFPIPSPNQSITVNVPAQKDVPAYQGPLPGHFRMRSRFVDFPGEYVIHCHILAHEDRGMMALVELKAPAASSVVGLFHHH
jgi:FtsP/CotA-like multicopper oxidase with cupredoxin domain